MHTLSETDIDDLCEQFEDGWCAETAGAGGVAAFTARSGVEVSVAPLLARALAEVDMERTWMGWAKKIDAYDPHATISLGAPTLTGSPVDDLVASLKRIVSFADYQSLFSGPDVFKKVQIDLARCESRCREQWGDALGLLHYQHHYGIDIGTNPDFKPRSVRIEIDGHRDKVAATFPLRGCNRFGRRRSFDTADFCFEETPDGNRIVAAGFREVTISRQHFSVQVLSGHKVAICNECPINPLRVMGQKELGFQQRIMVAYPFSIRLPGRTLRFS